MIALALYYLALFGTLLHLTLAVNNAFVFKTVNPLLLARIDPIVSPNNVSQHAHFVVGGSNFDKTYDPVKLRQSKCSNMPVQADKSNYWQPAVYKVHQNKSYEAMQSGVRIYYFFRQPSELPANQQLEPLPFDHRMLAGSPMRKSLDVRAWDAIGQKTMKWVCFGVNGTDAQSTSSTIPTTTCKAVKTKVTFPGCWNGNSYNQDRPYDHMRYPLGGFNGGACPDTHPRRLPVIRMEVTYYDPNYDEFAPDRKYILANGDTTGFGLHADFANGWDPDVLAGVVKDCTLPPVKLPANLACKHFVASFDPDTAKSCMYENDIPNEQVGFQGQLKHLPGCNPSWTNGAKPACTRKYYAANYIFWPSWIKPVQNPFQWAFRKTSRDIP